MIHPTIFIGLGSYGDNVVQKAVQSVIAKDPLYASIIADLVIDEEGVVRSYSRANQKQVLKLECENYICSERVFEQNLKAFYDKEEDLQNYLTEKINDMLRLEDRQRLIDSGISELSKHRVVIFAPLFDTVGSVFFIPLLRMLEKILNNKEVEVFTVSLLPDLSRLSKDSIEEIVADYEASEEIELLDKHKGAYVYRSISQYNKHGVLFLRGEGDRTAIDISDVDQGSVSNCYFMAALAAIALQSPDFIENMVVHNPDGTYTVRFFSDQGKEEFVTVDDKMWVADGTTATIYAKSGDKEGKSVELWPMILEKAWAKLNKGYENTAGRNRTKYPFAFALGGEQAIELKTVETKDTEVLFSQVLEHFEKKRLPVVFLSRETDSGTEERHGELFHNHCYALHRINERNKTFDLYNPHGQDHLVGLDMDTFYEHFESIQLLQLKDTDNFFATQYKTLRDFEYARAYCCLAEMEMVLSQEGQLINYPFIIGKKNIDDHSIGRFEDMLDSLGEFSYMLFCGRLSIVENAHLFLHEESSGKTNRYSSFGLATLTFPEAQIRTTYQALGKQATLSELDRLFRDPKSVARDELNLYTSTFIERNSWSKIYDLCGQGSDDGNPIYKGLSSLVKIDENLDPKKYLEQLDAAEEKYRLNDFNVQIAPAYGNRADALAKKLKAQLRAELASQFGKSENGINFAHGFTSFLLREDCDCVSHDETFPEKDLISVEQEILGFYQEKLGLSIGANQLKQMESEIGNEQREVVELHRKIRQGEERLEREKLRLEAGDKSTTVDKIKMESELVAMRDQSAKVEEELKAKIKQFESDYKNYEDFKVNLRQSSTRKQLWETDKKQFDEKAEQLEAKIHETETKLVDARSRVSSWKEKCSKYIRWWLVILPLVILAVFAVNAILEWELVFTTNAWKFILPFIVLVFAVYYVIFIMRYRKKFKAPLDQSIAFHDSVATDKITLLRDFVENKASAYQQQSEYFQHEAAYDCLQQLIDEIHYEKENIHHFKKKIQEQMVQEEVKVNKQKFKNNLFVRYIIGKEAVEDHFKETYQKGDFFDKPEKVLSYYQDFVKSNNLDKLNRDLEDHFSEKGAALSGSDIYSKLIAGDFDREEYKEIDRKQGISNSIDRDLNREIKKLVDAAKPYINLESMLEADRSLNVLQLCRDERFPQGEKILELVAAASGTKVSTFAIKDKNNINLMYVRMGFPAFKINIIQECRSKFQKLQQTSKLDAKDFFAFPRAVDQEMFPSLLLMGGNTDRQRRALTFARLFGLLVQGPDGYRFEGNLLGETLIKSRDFLALQKGRDLLERLEDKISLAQKSYNAEDTAIAKSMKDFLSSEANDFDEIDYRIIKEFNPSSI